MKTAIVRIFEFKSGEFVEEAINAKAAFDRCIDLYLRSDKKKSYYYREEA